MTALRSPSITGNEDDKNILGAPDVPIVLLPEVIQPISDDPPEGGLHAWLTVAGSCLIQFCVWGFANGVGQLQIYYAEHQLKDYSVSAISWISSIHTVMTYIGSLVTGRYFDSHGLPLLMRTGCSMIVISLVALAFSQEFYQIFLSHTLYGLGATVVYTPALAVMGHWFKRRRSTAIGLVIGGAGLGGIVYPIMFRELFARLSFRNSCLIVAGLNAALLFPTLFMMRTRLPPRALNPMRHVVKALGEIRYLCLMIGTFIVMINIFTPYFFAPAFALQASLPAPLPSYAIALLQTGALLGRISCGFLADRFGVWFIFSSCGFLSALIVFALWIPQTGVAGTIIALILFGAVSAAWLTLISASCADISRPEELGGRLGMFWTIVCFAVLAGPPISGALLKTDNGGFTLTGIFCGITYLVGTTITVLPPILRRIRGVRTITDPVI